MKLLTNIKTFFKSYKKWPEQIRFFLTDLSGWFKSVWIFLFRKIEKPAIMYGFSAFYFAKKYADRRSRRWDKKWDQMGKQQAVNPFNDTSLIVCSKMELKILQKRKIVNRHIRPRKAIKNAYYKTKL